MMTSVAQWDGIGGAKVLMRADFDAPVHDDGTIAEVFRIARQKETLNYLLSHGARVLVAAHITAVPSFAPLLPQIERILGVSIRFCRDFNEVQRFWAGSDVVALMENLRSDPGEEQNSEPFARALVHGADAYVNNAFAVCHRAHASVATAPTMLPSYAGLLVSEEVRVLSTVLDAPAQGKVVYMGGAKASTKAPVIRNIINKAEYVAVGGIVANDIFKVLGRDIGSSQVDDNAGVLLEGLDVHDARLVLPTDAVIRDGQHLDLGPQSAAAFAELASHASLVVWNGPMGKCEEPAFRSGTEVLARAIVVGGARSIIGGGDTIAAVDALGLLDKFTFVSTGGGAMLAFLAGATLPGLQALHYYA